MSRRDGLRDLFGDVILPFEARRAREPKTRRRPVLPDVERAATPDDVVLVLRVPVGVVRIDGEPHVPAEGFLRQHEVAHEAKDVIAYGREVDRRHLAGQLGPTEDAHTLVDPRRLLVAVHDDRTVQLPKKIPLTLHDHHDVGVGRVAHAAVVAVPGTRNRLGAPRHDRLVVDHEPVDEPLLQKLGQRKPVRALELPRGERVDLLDGLERLVDEARHPPTRAYRHRRNPVLRADEVGIGHRTKRLQALAHA